MRPQAPSFYAPTPPAPAGLQWWTYNAGVPPLPDPGSVLGQDYSSYAWRYDASYSAQSYTFSQLDNVSCSTACCRRFLSVTSFGDRFLQDVHKRSLYHM